MAFDRIDGPTGFFNFIRIDGRPHAPCRIITDISRPGVSGSAFRFDGARGDEYELRALINAESSVQAVGIENVLREWTGNFCIVTICDTLYQYQILKHSAMTSLRKAEKTVGGTVPNGTYVAEFRLVFQYGGPV